MIVQNLSLAQMIEQTDAGKTWQSWCRAHLRALRRGDTLMVRHTWRMSNRAYSAMQEELRQQGSHTGTNPSG